MILRKCKLDHKGSCRAGFYELGTKHSISSGGGGGGGSSSANIFVRASYASTVSNFSILQIGILLQGPRSNFEIGGGGGGGAPLVTQYWGDTKHFFLLTLYNFKNIGGGGTCPPAPLLRGPCFCYLCTNYAHFYFFCLM